MHIQLSDHFTYSKLLKFTLSSIAMMISEPLITHTYPLSQIEAVYGLFENKRDGAPWSVNFSYSNSELLVNRYHLWYNKIITDKVVILWKQKT